VVSFQELERDYSLALSSTLDDDIILGGARRNTPNASDGLGEKRKANGIANATCLYACRSSKKDW
jgi:hypothetical protein